MVCSSHGRVPWLNDSHEFHRHSLLQIPLKSLYLLQSSLQINCVVTVKSAFHGCIINFDEHPLSKDKIATISFPDLNWLNFDSGI